MIRDVIKLFIMTTKLTKTKVVVCTLLLGAFLCAMIFAAASIQHGTDNDTPSPEHIVDNDGRVAYLSAWGWEISPSAVETLDLLLPTPSGDTDDTYQAIQADQGMDLSSYYGKRVKRYTYNVLNYPDQPQGVHANLYLYGDTVIAGDITASGPDGFIAGLRFPAS